jgi:excisionase family DNA binding protein
VAIDRLGAIVDGVSFDAVLDNLAALVAKRVVAEISRSERGGRPQTRLYTIEQAATYIGRTREAFQQMIASGKLTTVRSDRRVFIDVLDLDRWIEQYKEAGLQ